MGGGTTLTGITETGNIAFNLGLNSSETKALDDVQLRVGDRQVATFREGSRYPIVSSTYSSGLSTAASALGKDHQRRQRCQPSVAVCRRKQRIHSSGDL